MAFSRGWHPLAVDVISASMGMGREKGQLGIPLSLAASCIKNTSPLLRCTTTGCPFTVPGQFVMPKDILLPPPLPLLFMLPSFLPGWGPDITPTAGQHFEVHSIISVGNAHGPHCCWGWRGNHESPTKSWTLVQPHWSCQTFLPLSSLQPSGWQPSGMLAEAAVVFLKLVAWGSCLQAECGPEGISQKARCRAHLCTCLSACVRASSQG